VNVRIKLQKISKAWYFFIIVVVAYIFLLFIKQSLFFLSLNYFLDIFVKIIPVFAIIFILMAISNYFVTPEFIRKYFGKRGMTKWFFVIIGGILSSGPIYMWYPFLADLKNKGLSYGLVACFLYNRAIKIPLWSIAIFYFGVEYIVVLAIVMIFMSIIQGILLNKFMKGK